MPDSRLHVLQVNTQDVGGGAEAIARNLYLGCRARGHDSQLAVGRRYGDDPDVLQIPNGDELKSKQRLAAWVAGRYPPLGGDATLPDRLKSWLSYPLADGMRRLRRWLDKARGREDFRFPGTQQLLSLGGDRPDLLHIHNLHGNYFDLTVLPSLCRQVPVALTLHDAWTFSGHCAHAIDCDRWMTGCGACPDLTIYPEVKRDATAFNWQRKQEIFGRCRLYLATPSQWLMRRVQQSILQPAVAESRVIPNGVDQSIFAPGDTMQARRELGLPADAEILLFAANGIRNNSFKDYATLRRAVQLIAQKQSSTTLMLLALGEDSPAERIGNAELRFIAPVRDAAAVARYYQAADLYLHAARADTFPTTVIESLSCGTPVVATAVGGIPEQVRSVASVPALRSDATEFWPVYDAGSATGALVPGGDADAMAQAIARLLDDSPLRHRLAENAVRDARERFSLATHIDAYLEWYQAILCPRALKAA